MTDAEISLVRCNLRTGEILSGDGKVVGRVVPVEPTDEQCAKAVCIARVWPNTDLVNVPKQFVDVVRGYHKAMLSAATIDLSATAVRVPDEVADAVKHCVDVINAWSNDSDRHEHMLADIEREFPEAFK